MSRKKPMLIYKKFIPFLCVIFFGIGCSRSPQPISNHKPLVLVSIAPYVGMVADIGGELIEVKSIIPENANPHIFEPTLSHMTQIASAAVWFRIGEPFETKLMAFLKDQNPSLKIIDLRDGLSLLTETGTSSCSHCSSDHLDRHIWLSPVYMIKQATSIQKALSQKFPEHASLFQENLLNVQAAMNTLHKELTTLLTPLKKKSFIVSHPAFGYFCKEYECNQISVEYEGKDPRPKHIEKILRQGGEHHALFALLLPQYNNKGAEQIASILHIPTQTLNPYAADYFTTLRLLANYLADQPDSDLP